MLPAPLRNRDKFVCMKRTNVVLDEHLLEEAVKVSGEKTYARTIERALTEMVRRARARSIEAILSGCVRTRFGHV